MNEFIKALHYDKKDPRIPEEYDFFGALVGEWNIEWVDHLEADEPRRVKGEWIFSWVLEGTAIQDVFIVPSRSERLQNKQPDAEYQRHDEISRHPCPKVPHHHFHIVHVFVNDSTYLAQPFIGVETKREHFQFQDDLLTDALHEIEAGKVLAHIGYGIGYGFQNQQTNEYPRCRNERNAFARYMAVDKEQDSKHYCRSAKGINHEKQCGDYQMPHSANGQFIQYIAYHCLYLLLFQLPFAYPFLCFRHIAI